MADKEKKFFNEDADFDKMPDFNNDVDDYNGFDSNGEEDNSRDPVPVKMMKDVGRTLSYAGSKASEGAATGIREKLESAFPEATASYDTVTQAVGEAQMGWDQFQNEARPVWNKLKITTKQFARNMKGLLPLGLDQKLVNFLDEHFPNEEKFKEPSLKEQREANLSNILGEVFKLQTEKSMENQQNEMVNRAIDDRLTQKRHAESVAIEGSIKNAVLFQADFTKSIFTSYLKKDLELKYRHFYVAQDTLSTLVNTTKMLQERLTAIVKNTGLPDSQKVQLSETAKKMMKEKFLSTLGSKTSNLFTTIRENMGKQIIKPFVSVLQTINDAVAGINDMAEQQETMEEMGGGGEPAMFSYANIAGMGIGALGRIVGRKAAQGVLKLLPRTVRDKIELYSNKPLRRLRDWMFEQRKKNNDPDNPSLLGMIADKLLGRFDNNYKLENYTFKNLNKPGSITNKTIMTIEQIIPGFLSMQTKFLEMIATKNEHVEQKVYDFRTKKFVGEKEQTTNNLKNLFGNSKQRGSALGAYATTTNQTISKVYSTDNKKRLDLIGLQAANAKDIELFKFGLALSDKHYSYSRSDLDIIRDVAKSGDAGKVSDDIKKSDFWKYGFSICEHPIGVAKFLEAYLFDDNGHVNDLALKTFKDQVENINEDKVPRIKEYIFDAEERGDHTIGDNVGKRDANGDLIIDPAKLLKFFANGASDSEFNKSFELNTARAANDKNWSTDDHTLMENLFHQVKTSFQNGAIGQTISSWAEKGENIFKNVHKGILHLFGWKDKDIDKNFESIDKTLHKGIEWAQGQVEDFKKSWAKTKKFFGDGINHATLALAAKFFSGKDNAYRKLYKVFFYTKDAGKDLEGQPRNINAVDFINVVLNDKGLRDIFKSFAKDVQKGNFGAQAVVDILSETFPWFGETFSLFVEHDGKEAAFREIFDIDDEKKRNKAVIETIQKLKHYKETRATRWSSGISASNRAEDEYNKSQKAKEVEKKNSITTDTKPKSATVTTIDLLTKNEQHLFKIEGALADIHAIYISEHKGYEGLKTARESLSKELGLLKNADYDDTKERRELYQRYQKLRAEAVDIKDDATRAGRLDDLDTDYQLQIANLDKKKSQHYDKLRNTIENGEAAKSSFSKNASYMDSLIRENTSVAEKAHITMRERDAEAEYRERDAQQLMDKSKITERLTGNKAKRVAKAKEQVIDEQYKDQIIKNLTADPTIINSLIIEGKLKEKPQGTTNEEKANNVYNALKEKGELYYLLDKTVRYSRSDLDTNSEQRAEFNKNTKLNNARHGNFNRNKDALRDELTEKHKQDQNFTIRSQSVANGNAPQHASGVSIYENQFNAVSQINKNVDKVAKFRLLYEQIQRKGNAAFEIASQLAQLKEFDKEGREIKKVNRKKFQRQADKIKIIMADVTKKFSAKPIDQYTEQDITDDALTYLQNQLKDIPEIKESQLKFLNNQTLSSGTTKKAYIQSQLSILKKNHNSELADINNPVYTKGKNKGKNKPVNFNYKKATANANKKYNKQKEDLQKQLNEAENTVSDQLKYLNGGIDNLSSADKYDFSNIKRNLTNIQFDKIRNNDLVSETVTQQPNTVNDDWKNFNSLAGEYGKNLDALRKRLLGIQTDTENKLSSKTDILSKTVLGVKRHLVNDYLKYVDQQLARAYSQDESITNKSFDYLKELNKRVDSLDNDTFISKENRDKLQEIVKKHAAQNNAGKNLEQINWKIDGKTANGSDNYVIDITLGTAETARQKDIDEIEKKKQSLTDELNKALKELAKPSQEAKEKLNSEFEALKKDLDNLKEAKKNKKDEYNKAAGSVPGVMTKEDHDKKVKERDAKIKAIDGQIADENKKYKEACNKIINDTTKSPDEKRKALTDLKKKYDDTIANLKSQKEQIQKNVIPEVATAEQVKSAQEKVRELGAQLKKAQDDIDAKQAEADKKYKELNSYETSKDILKKINETKKEYESKINDLDNELTKIKDPNNQKYKDAKLISEEKKQLTSDKKKTNSDWQQFINNIITTFGGGRNKSTESDIADFEKRQAEERQKRLEEEAKKATKHATGGNYIKDGTSLEKFGGVTDGWTSVLNGTGIAGEAGAETILPHKANERFKKLIYNAIALTFGKTAADRATRALHPNKSTMEQLDMDVDMYAKGTNRPGRRRKVTNEQRKNKRIKRRNKKAAQQAADDGDDDSDADTVETTTDETTQPEERSLFGKLWDGLKGFWNKSKEEVEAEENQTTTETKKDEDGRRKVTLDSSIKEILFAQLETLREIADKSFIGFGFGDWHIDEAFKDLKGWVGKKYQGFKNWLNSSHWLGDKVKGLLLSPLRITDSLIRNRVFNVYELPAGKDEKVGTPLITVDDFKKGLYTDAELKNRLKSVDDIKGPIWDKDGKQVISEKNIEAGLCDEHKKPINSFARQIGRFLRRRLGNVRDLAKGIGAGGWSFVKSLIFNEVFDIYKNPQNDKEDLGSPVITVADFEVGIYLDAECTKRIKSVADITGAVYDNTGKLKIKEEDLPLLCDVNRKPINSFAARLGRFFRRRLSIVPSIVKSPLRFVGNLLFNNVCNVYKNPGNDKEKLGEPLIRVDDFEAGLYLDKEKTKKITSVADITGPVYDHTGTCRITEEDIKAGLVDEDRKPINSFAARLGRTFRHGIGGIFGKIANLHPIQTLKKVAMAPINFLSWVNKRNVDVYSKRDPKKLLVAAKDIEEGLLQYANGEIVKAASDIDQPVWWTDNAKNGAKARQIAISQEDIDAGLIENDGTDLKGRLGIAGDIGKHAISSLAKLGGKIITAPIKLGKFLVKELIIGENDPFIDVYVVDRRYKTGLKRALEGTKIESGAYYTLKEDGTREPLKAAYDIGSEVYETVNDKPKCLITKKNLKDGLYDANGKRIRKGRLNGLAIRAGSALIHGTGKLIHGAWNGIKSIAGKGLDLAGGLFSKIFGSDVFGRIGGFFKNLFHPTSFFLGRRDLYELVTVQLMKIYDLLDQRMKKPKNVKGDADGDGDRDGSYEDFEQKLKERKAERKAKQDEKKKKEKEEKKKEKKDKEQQKKAEEAAENDGSGFLDSLGTLFGSGFGSWIGSGRKKPGTPTPETAGGKKGIFKKLFGKLFSPFVKRGAGAGAAGNAAGQVATRAGTQTIAEGADVLRSARTQLPTEYVDYVTRLTGGKPNGIPNLIESAGSRFARAEVAGAAGNAAGNTAARAGTQAAGSAARNTVKKGLLHRLGNIGTKIVGKSAARAVLGASVAALNVVPVVGQIINIAFWGATAATIGYEILKTNPMDLRWQRVRFPAYGLDKSGTFYEFAYEDSIKDLEKETFKAIVNGKQAADDSAIEHFGQSIGFLAGSIGLTISDNAIKDREKRLMYLRYWYYLRFLAPFLAYCEIISAYRPDNIPETDFPDPATINFDLQDQAIDKYKEQLDKIKSNKKVYDDRFDLTDNEKYKKWVEDSEKAEKEAKKHMSVGERALAEAMETDNITDDNFDYTNTKNYFSQMWYNIKHGNLIDATGDAIMGVASVVGETISGAISLVFKDWIWHGLGFGSTNYQDAWHKAKLVLYGLDEKVDIDDLEDFEETVGPIINKRESELRQDDLLDEIDDLLDETDCDTDDFIDAAVAELGIDKDKAKQKVLDYIYTWYTKRFKVVLGSFLVIGRLFEGKKDNEAIDKFDVEDIPEEAREEVLQSFTKKTEEQLKKNDSEKYKLTVKDFVECLRTDKKLIDSSKKLKKNKPSIVAAVAKTAIYWSNPVGAIIGLNKLGKKIVSHGITSAINFFTGRKDLTDYELDWKKRYKYYNFSKDIFDQTKIDRKDPVLDGKIAELEDFATDIFDKKISLSDPEARVKLCTIANKLGFVAWGEADREYAAHHAGFAGRNEAYKIDQFLDGIDNASTKQFYAKQYNAKSQYLFDWFKTTFFPIFTIFLQVVRKNTETKKGKVVLEAIPEQKREDAIKEFIDSANLEINKSKHTRLVLGDSAFKQYYNELNLIEAGIKSDKFKTNALNLMKQKESDKDAEDEKLLSSVIKNNNSLVTSLTKVDQNIANKTKVKLKGANLAVLKESMSHIEFIDPKLSQKENWRRLAYWAYGIAKDKVATQDIPVTGHQPLGYFYRKLEKLTFNRWYHNKDFNEKDIDSTLSSLYFVTDLYEEKDGNWSRSEKLKYLKEWYEKRFVPMFWTLTKAIEQQHVGGSGEIIDLKNLNIAYSDWEIFENMTELPEPEFQALVLATVDELKKQLGNIGYLTPSLMGYRKWNITQIKKEKGSIGNNVSDTSEKTVDTSIDKMYEQFDKTVADAKAKDKSTSYSNSMFTKDSINRKLLKKSVSINTNEIPNMNYSYVHANEFADNTEPVQKFASGGVISRPTKLGRNILAGEAGTETILPHKAGKNFNNLVTNAVSDAYDRNTASAVNMILAGSNAATDTTIDAINRKYGQTINGTGSNWQDAAYRRSLEKYYITDEELDEPLSSSTDLLLFNIYKKISTVSKVFEKASTGKKFDTVNPEKNKSVFDYIKDTLSDGWETIKSGASSAWDTVTSAASGAWDSATSAVSAGFSAAKEYGGAMVDKAKDLFGFGSSNKSVQSGNISKDAEDTAMRIWKYFKSKGWSDQAIAGLLGNMYKESRLSSLRLQGDLSQDLAKSKVYTEKADKDLNFFKHGIGYGLCQWTYGARKENLWKFCHDKGVSVGDTNMQIAFVDYEINNGGMSKRFRDILMHSNDVNMATAIILKVYEKPARMDDPAELQERARYAHEWYDKMTKKGNDSSIWSTVSDVGQYVVDKGKQVLQFGEEVAGAVGSSIKDTATDIANGNFGNIVSRTAQGAVDLGSDAVEAINSSKNAEVVCPTDTPVITSQFGKRHVKGGSSNHQGIDLRAKPIGQPIYAAEAGTVSYVNPKSYGAIWIEQQDGLQARYLHNSKILVKKGDKVKAGQMIALSGGTDKFGNVSHYPPHLHFEIRRNGKPIDPEIWLRSKGIKLSLNVGHAASAHMPPLSDVGVETIDNKGREVTTPEIPAYANGSSSYYQTADQNIKSTETAQGATGNASSNVGIVSTAADSILQDRNAHSAVSTSIKAEPVSTEAPVITTDSVASGNIGTDTSSIGNQQLAELKIISGLLRDIRNGEKTVPDRKIDTETTLNSTSANTSETDALSQLIPILQTIADKLSDTSTTTPIINQTTTGIPTKKRQFAFPLDIAKRA